MTKTDMLEWLEFARGKTLGLLDAVATRPDALVILKWRPGPGRAHLAWQLMHIAATDDRHLTVRMKGGEPSAPDLVKSFAGGSVPDENGRASCRERARASRPGGARKRNVQL